MTDLEFILFLCKIIWAEASDGDVPDKNDWETMYNELEARGIDTDEVFGY
jgi:hypothetical protein